MRVSEIGLGFIKRGERFVDRPYDDGYGNPTIGYGHKIKPTASQ
jgi:GH24 family phage-related lysozyme (muramidase)